MLTIRSSEVSAFQALTCFAMFPVVKVFEYDKEHVLTVLVAGGKCSTGLGESACCPCSPDLCASSSKGRPDRTFPGF